MFLRSKDSNTGVFLWISQNFYEQLFYRIPPLAASALNFTLYFQVVNSGCTIWIRELFTWIEDISCLFICSFVFVIFSSHVGILVLIGSFSSSQFDKMNTSYIFSKFDQTNLIKQILLCTLSNLFDSINLIKLIWPYISGFRDANQSVWNSKAALQRRSYKKLFWKYATNLQENTHAEV